MVRIFNKLRREEGHAKWSKQLDAGPKAKNRQGLFVKSCPLSLPAPQSLAQLSDSRHLIKLAICQVSMTKLAATPSPAFPHLSGKC